MRRIALLLSITLVFFAAGCAKSNNQDAASTKQEMDVTSEPAVTGSGSTTVYGRVDSIVGNEVVLALGEPQQDGSMNGQSSSGQDNAQAGGEQQSGTSGAQSGDSGEQQRGSWGGNTSGSAPSGGMPSGEAPSGEMPSGEAPSGNASAAQSGNTGMRQSRSVSLTYSGETATYLLPVGMAIETGDFSDVTVGMVLSLTLNAEDTITAVSILSR